MAVHLSIDISFCLQTHRKANKQQSPQGLTCALDKTLEGVVTENTPYKTIDVVSITLLVSLVGRDTLFIINVLYQLHQDNLYNFV